MSLFYFEFRKLLLNKKTAVLLVCLFILYSLVGFVTSMFLIGSGKSYHVYEELAAGYEGKIDEGKAAWAEKIYEEVSARYGTDSRMIARSIKDQPETMLALKYNEFTERVDEYWNGTPPESGEEPYGIALLEAKLSELEMQGKQDTFAYTKLSGYLKRLAGLGEPEFANILLWENLFVNWGEHMMQFLLFIPLTFIIAPVFAVERSTGMDHLVLSSRSGRRKIVTAKLFSILAASVTVTFIYVAATFIFGFLPHASLHGWNAAIQSVPAYAKSMFGFKTWQLAVAGAAWLIFTGAVYSIIIGFVSSRMKSQMGTVGVSLAILFINAGLAAMGDSVTQKLQPLTDFGLADVTLIKEVFGGFKTFRVSGMCVSYPVMAVLVLSLAAALAGFGIYYGQRNRTVE